MIAYNTVLKLKDVRRFFAALRVIARKEVGTTGKFIIPGLATLTVREKPVQRSSYPDWWGIHKRTKKVIKVVPKKYLKDSVAAVPWHQTCPEEVFERPGLFCAMEEAMRMQDEDVGVEADDYVGKTPAKTPARGRAKTPARGRTRKAHEM